MAFEYEQTAEEKAWEERQQKREKLEYDVQEALVKLLCDSQASGVSVIVNALEEAASHYDNCCDPHAEAELLDLVDKIKDGWK